MSANEKRAIVRECLAEFIGTFILVLMGDSATASYSLKSRDASRMDGLAICLGGWGMGFMLAVMATAGTSGAHLNPAVSICQAVLGNFPWRKVGHYCLSQLLGAMAAAAVVHITFLDGLQSFDGGVRIATGHQDATGQIFATYPSAFVTLTGAIVDQVVGTALLMFAIMVITDSERQEIPKHVQPIYLGLVLTGICVSLGLNCSAILNPARDLGPRIWCALTGYGWYAPFAQPLAGNYWWAAGIMGPIIGAVVGGLVYRIFLDHANLRRNSFYHISRKVELSDLPRAHTPTPVTRGRQLSPVQRQPFHHSSQPQLHKIPEP